MGKTMNEFEDAINKFSESLGELAGKITPSIEEAFKGIGTMLEGVSNDFQKAVENPGEALKNLSPENQFSNLFCSYYSEDKLNERYDYIEKNIPEKYKETFAQVKKAMNDGSYVLVNNTTGLIVDDLLDVYLEEKKSVSKDGLLNPVTSFLEKNFSLENIPYLIELKMLEGNINEIFSGKALVNNTTNQKRFSNMRIDAVYSISALYWMLQLNEKLSPFINTIKYDEATKKFVLDETKCKQIEALVKGVFQNDK